MAYCPKCGASLPDNARFCGICGARMAAAPANGAYGQPARQSSQYTQPQQPAYRDTRQYTQPQQPVYQNRQPAYDSRQYRQQQNYTYTPQPAYGNDYGWTRPEPDRQPVRHVGFLRFLSLLFAVGLIAAAAAFGCKLYFDRTFEKLYDESVTAVSQANGSASDRAAAENLRDDILSKNKGDIKDILAAVIREDPSGLKDALKDTLIDIMKNTDGLSAVYASDRSSFDSFAGDLTGAIEDRLITEYAKVLTKDCSDAFGIRWLMLQAGVRWMMIAIAGGALAFLCFLLWLVCRGPAAGAGRSWFVPMLILAILLGIAVIAVPQFVVEPVTFRELQKAVTEAPAPDWSEQKTAEINTLGSKTSQNLTAVIEKHQLLLYKLIAVLAVQYPELTQYLNFSSLPLSL